MISDKIPTLESIRTLAEKIKDYIGNIHIFKNYIKIQNSSLNTDLEITSSEIQCTDRENNDSLDIVFLPNENKIDIGNANLANLAEPLEDNDAVTKQYVDDSIQTLGRSSVITLTCSFDNDGQIKPVSTFSSRVKNFTDLKNQYDIGACIKIRVVSTIPNYHFIVDCYITNYDNYEECFFIPIYYKNRDSNTLESKTLKIFTAVSSHDTITATLLNY